MGEEVNAAMTTDAPVTASAPVEESTVDNSMDTSEKTEISQEGQQDNQTEEVSQARDENGQLIPKARLDEVIRERNELRERIAKEEATRQEQERLASMTPQDRAQQEQLEVAQKALKKMGFLTQEDFTKAQQQEQAKNMFISEMNRLESKYDGSDGMPKFVPSEIAGYMDDLMSKGIQMTDPEMAYRNRHFDAIVDAKAKAQKSTVYTEKQSGGVQQVNDTRSSELEAAAESGDIRSFLKKYATPKDL